MIFVYPITISKNTPATAPTFTVMPIQPGLLYQMDIQYPSGVIALAHIQINRGRHQLYPTNAEQDFASSNETIKWDEDIVFDTPPYELVAITWNTDTAFDHTITVRIKVKDPVGNPNLAQEVAALLAAHGAA